MLVYDITDAKSFENLESWKDEFLVHAAPRNPDSFPFVCIGNKADLAARRQVPTSKAKAWGANNHNMPHYETSAKEALNVEQAFYTIAKNALAQEAQQKPIFIPQTLVVTDQQPKESESKCC